MKIDDAAPVSPSMGAMRRVRRVIDYLDGRAVPDHRNRTQAVAWNPGIQRARVTVAIPSGTEADPSDEGRVRLKRKNAAGAWVDDDEAVTVWCDFGVTGGGTVAPVGRMVRVSWIAGEWWIVSGSCT